MSSDLGDVLMEGGSSVASDIEALTKAIDSLKSEVHSIVMTYNNLNTEVQTRFTRLDSWTESHEKIDNERWEHLEEKLSEVKGLIESIPVKLAEDIGRLEAKDEQHEEMIDMLRRDAEASRKSGDEALWKIVNVHADSISKLKGIWLAVAGSAVLVGLFAAVAKLVKGG